MTKWIGPETVPRGFVKDVSAFQACRMGMTGPFHGVSPENRMALTEWRRIQDRTRKLSPRARIWPKAMQTFSKRTPHF
jgi:hypothetical protein